MRFQRLPFLLPALLLLALAGSLAGLRSAVPTGDEATSVMLVQSLWHDRDLAYSLDDLQRAERIWDGGPAGLTLFSNDGGKTLRYGRPLAYPLAALPFYGLFGLRGIALFNMALFLAMAGAALWSLAEETGLAHVFGAGFFFASAALAYAFRLEPEVFVMACVFFSLLLWRRLRAAPDERRPLLGLAGGGALLGAALVQSPAVAVLGLAVLGDLAWRRRWRGLLAVALGGLLAAGLLLLAQKGITGEWAASGGLQRRTFETSFPLQGAADLWEGHASAAERPADLVAGLRLLPRNLLYVLAGRFTGLLPYFPFALFALLLYLLGPKDRSRHLLLAALAAYVVAVLLLHPHGFAGDAGFLGSRYLAAIYPAFFFLPGRIDVRRALVLPFAAAGLWTAVAVAGSLARLNPEAVFQSHTAAPAFQRLPLELTLLQGDRLPGFYARTFGEAVWLMPRDAFFADEMHPNGVWMRGSSRAEVIVVSPAPLRRLAFDAYSLAAESELAVDSGAERQRVRFDSEGKRGGAPVGVAAEPVGRNLGFFPNALRERFYRLKIEVTGGAVPSRLDPRNGDPRDLGVFLSFTGQGF